MESLIEHIITQLNALPQTRLHEVLSFVEFVHWQEQHATRSNLTQADATIHHQDFEALTNQLIDAFSSSIPPNVPSLSDFAVSRAGIYEEHP